VHSIVIIINDHQQRVRWDAVTGSSRAATPPAGQPGPVPGSGGPRSEGTRRAILHAARAMFAARGYEQTTIRAVAAEADVDASMVMRYFQSKERLFTAAVITDLQVPDLGQRLTERIAALGEEQAPGRAALIAAQLLGLALCRYILRFEPLASLSADEVVAAVAPSVDRYLDLAG
jgi:AcrR family transcriptional regulator